MSSITSILKESGVSLEELGEILASPQKFAEHFLKNPEQGTIFKSNIIQKQILDAIPLGHTHNVISVHRRAGKTFALVILAIYLLMTMENGKILFMAPFNSQVEAFFDELNKFIEFHPWIRDSMVESTKNPYRKKFANGTIIRGMTTGSKAKQKAGSARGQGAHYILLDEVAYMSDEDFASLKPIIEGDAYHKPPTVFAVSTPMAAAGQFYRWVSEKDNGWNKILCSILENPDWSKKRVEGIRREVNQREWQTEYLCEFLNVGDSVFNLNSLKNCGSINLRYDQIQQKPISAINPVTRKPIRNFWRTMGVDWDKFNLDGSGPTIVIVDVDERPASETENGQPGDGKIRVSYRESIPQSEYCLTKTVDRIIELNRMYQPDVIQVDAGYGELQVESLHLYGKKHPDTRLDIKVRRQHFSEKVEIQDPLGGVSRKPFKDLMVNILSKWIEDEVFEYPKEDLILYEQFRDFKLQSQSQYGVPIYSGKNDHIISAAGLACYAMFQIHSSPFRHQIALFGRIVAPQEIVPGEDLTEVQRSDLRRRSPVTALLVKKDIPSDMDRLLKTTVTYDDTPLFPPTGKRQNTQENVRDLFARRTTGSLLTGRRRSKF